MADDPLSKFTARVPPRQPTASASRPAAAQPPALVVNHSEDNRQAYEAFENQVRALNLELRCHRSGLSHFLPYAHMGPITYNFRTGAELFFTGAGLAVTITGRSLRDIVVALNLHTCGYIQEFSHEAHILPEPFDRSAPFVESITVEVLRPPRPGEAASSAAATGQRG